MYIYTNIHTNIYAYTQTYTHTHLHTLQTQPEWDPGRFDDGFALSPCGPRSPTCRSLRPSTEPRLRTSWCTQSCCGGPWTTSPAEVRGPAGSKGSSGKVHTLWGTRGSETNGTLLLSREGLGDCPW